MWCFARLFHYPGAELLQAISLYCLRHWHRFKPQELANMIWSLALLRACSPHTWWAAVMRRVADNGFAYREKQVVCVPAWCLLLAHLACPCHAPPFMHFEVIRLPPLYCDRVLAPLQAVQFPESSPAAQGGHL